MNVQEYISSGIIESYVLGLASAEERSEFENMCAQHAEVLEARISFELAMERQAMQNAIAPPEELKQIITDAALSTGKIIRMKTPYVKTNWFKYVAAACIVLLTGSVIWNITLYNRNQQLKNNYNNTVARLDDIEKEISMIRQNPNVKMAAMKGMEISPSSYATVYWDSTSKDVYLLVNNLPKPPDDKQYQLWALFDNQPIDAGMIDNNFFIGENKLLLRMKNARNAQAFAITLEKKGGNSTPQGAMYVMGHL